MLFWNKRFARLRSLQSCGNGCGCNCGCRLFLFRVAEFVHVGVVTFRRTLADSPVGSSATSSTPPASTDSRYGSGLPATFGWTVNGRHRQGVFFRQLFVDRFRERPNIGIDERRCRRCQVRKGRRTRHIHLEVRNGMSRRHRKIYVRRFGRFVLFDGAVGFVLRIATRLIDEQFRRRGRRSGRCFYHGSSRFVSLDDRRSSGCDWSGSSGVSRGWLRFGCIRCFIRTGRGFRFDNHFVGQI